MAGRPSGRREWREGPRAWRLVATGCALAAVVLIVTTDPVEKGPPRVLRLAVDLNTAPPAVLAALPRIGPVLAARIVEAREQAPLSTCEDLARRVRGIGSTTIAALWPHLRFPAEDATPQIAARLASRPRPGSDMP